jgi:hypothetical protein
VQHIRHISLAAILLAGTAVAARSEPVFVNNLSIAGDATDASGDAAGANGNRLGGFGSDLFYDRANNVYYGLPDRGPGGGLIAYETRVQKFTLDVNPTTGAISNFKVIETVKLKNNSTSYNGLNPFLLNGSKSTLGLSLDPEGIVVDKNGNMYISDEYGPSIYKFDATGNFIGSLNTPANLVPREADGTTKNYVDGRTTIRFGRQDNRGFEGLTISPDGTKLYAMLQDPLVNEGAPTSGIDDGRRSRNLRMVEFDIATGDATKQMIYRLEDRADINARLSPGTPTLGATNQGRSIGISSLTAISDTKFLVIERDNRGDLSTDPAAQLESGSKRVYEIDISGATDVSGISLAGSNSLPGGVVPVSKGTSPYLDILAALRAAGLPIPEKIEGLTFGPQLADGSYLLLIGTDNDLSVTQTGSGAQFNVCTDGVTFNFEVPITDACPAGFALIPSNLYAFRVPEPSALGLLGLGLAGLLGLRRRR